jgi:hypothetical protein
VFASTPTQESNRVRRRLFKAYWYDGRETADPSELNALGGAAMSGKSERAARWREPWLGLGPTVVPMLVLPDGYISRGLGALARLPAPDPTRPDAQPTNR